jgi:hypothetical protein
MLRVVAVGAVITPVGIVGCGGDDDDSEPATFAGDAFPFTFEYPDEFEFTEDVSAEQQLGGSDDAADEAVAIAMDEDNGLIIERHTLNAEVSPADMGLVKREFDGLIQQLDPDADGEEGNLAGFPSLTYAAVPVPGLNDGESRLIVLFEGDEEYIINCQSTPDGREEIEQACDRAVDTLARRA